MVAKGKSPHAHGPSEIWSRDGVARAIAREQKRLGKRIRALRQERGLTQEQAAETMGLHPKYLTRLEQGSANATLGTLVAVSVAFKVKLRDLFTEDDSDTGKPEKG